MNSDPWSIQPLIGPILIIVGLIIVHALLAAMEMAVVSVSSVTIMEESIEGNQKAKRVMRILENSDNYVTSIQVAVTLTALMISGVSIVVFTHVLNQTTRSLLQTSPAVFVISTIVVTYLLMLLGNKLPRAMAAQNSHKAIMSLSGLLVIIHVILKPIVWLIQLSLRGLKHVLPMTFDDNKEAITRDEFRTFIEHSHKHDVIDMDEFTMLKGVLSLDNKIAREVMVPRTDAFMLDYDDPNEENIQAMLETPHSRVPLYYEDKDNILGIVHVKNLLQASKNQPLLTVDLKEISNPPLFVPETIYIDDLIFQMKRTQNQMAILNDEYGGVIGIVTLEDLLEEIVGEIDDEYDKTNKLIEEIGEFLYSVDGATPLDKFNDFFETSVDSEDVDTIAGYFITELGSIPEENETSVISAGNWNLTVEKMDGTRISSLFVKRVDHINDSELIKEDEES